MKNISVLFIASILLFPQFLYSQKIDINARPGLRRNHSLLFQKSVTTDYLPLIENDSFFSERTGQWNYGYEADHQYYQSNCKDSLVTEIDDFPIRNFYKWDPNGFFLPIETISQEYNDTGWEAVIDLLLNPQCVYYDYIDLYWNGVKWDTSGTKYLEQFNDKGNLISVDVRNYNAQTWKPYQLHKYSYNSDNVLDKEIVMYWNGTSYDSSYMYTNQRYKYFNSSCDNDLTSEYYWYWEFSSNEWVLNGLDSSLFYAGGDLSGDYYFFSWTGSQFLESEYGKYLYDSHNNLYYWEQLHKPDITKNVWDTDYVEQTQFTYGPNGELLRQQSESYGCDSNFNKLTQCSIINYKNFITCDLSSIETPAELRTVTIYPDPANDKVYFSRPWKVASPSRNLFIFDITGKLILTQELNSNSLQEINVEHFPDGFYTILIQNGKQRFTGKFVKQ